MKIQIDFFTENFIDAIGAGVYKVSVCNENNETETLYVGESESVLARCASHLYTLKKQPHLWGFTEKTIENPNTKLIFSLVKQENDMQQRKILEKEIIKTEKLPISQSGISDRLKEVEERILSLSDFLNSDS